MQTTKARTGSLEVPQRTSPTTTRTARQLKMPGAEGDSPSPTSVSRTPKERNLKVAERRSPRSPATEKKRPSKVTDMEPQLAQLQDDLKKAKDQLGMCELQRKYAQQEAEEAHKRLKSLTSKLDESQRQLLELTNTEDDRLQELRQLSQERDRAWQSELDALLKQHSLDSAALASAMHEVHRLKMQQGSVVESEAPQNIEFENLKLDLADTRSAVENLKGELRRCKESEAQAKMLVGETLMQLETAKTTMETLRSDNLRAKEAYDSLASELEQSRFQVNALETLCKHQGDPSRDALVSQKSRDNSEVLESNQLKVELNFMRLEVEQLRNALDAAKVKYEEEAVQKSPQLQSAHKLLEQTQSEYFLRESELEAALKQTKADMEDLKLNLVDKESELQTAKVKYEEEAVQKSMQLQSAHKLVEQRESEYFLRESELESALEQTKADIKYLKSNLVDKESELQSISDLKLEHEQANQRESELDIEMKKLKAEIADLRANMMDKETELQNLVEENETLKSEIEKQSKEIGELGYLKDEVDKSGKRALWVTEQLEAAQTANSEMEVELRRLKVQADQWRKAAEAATAVLSTESNGKFDFNYHSVSGTLCSPYSDEMDDESPKKSNMLKKIGVLWKKQK
ncbi:interactor of constitutive active ROPs 2, chloroplastic-like [Papaver somniferum]|nr:interactor of constitutive active ROPs 2, chloroplastic-like [Papaver somniferum]XP_026427076.1 interactor of constitutive active ROPs 2, chloroplastic-like [Papaver somniferum]XP_026427077.1 interactor of constitutive active ROPs 2, chloroplastic-like [Papaver somniferum]XP_026427078.1 interactor of constitutive active ROPs 2, chloroplastic-like [Papaver somniferum]